MAEARELADEATQAARAAAEEAHRQAQQLAADAEQQAKDADQRVAAAERAGKVTAATAEDTAQRLDTCQINGDLESHTKAELLDLAAAIDIEGRTTLTKAELVTRSSGPRAPHASPGQNRPDGEDRHETFAAKDAAREGGQGDP